MSTFTPTSRYVNCVLTSGLTNPAPPVEPTPTPAWKLPVDRTDFRVLNDFGVGIGQDSVGRCARQRHAVVLRTEMFQIAQREGIGCRCAARCSSSCAARC